DFLLDDISRGGIWVKSRVLPADPAPVDVKQFPETEESIGITRSDFLAKTRINLDAIPFTSLSGGIISGDYDYRIRLLKFYLPNLPKAFHGMKIGQLSDIHSGSFYNQKAVLGGVEMLLGEKPDMIFFTGDLVNNLASELKDYRDIFSKLNAPLGLYSVLG